MDRAIPVRRAAVFTLQRDEIHQLPRWWNYYRRHFDPEDIYIVDHNSTEPSIHKLLNEIQNAGANIIPVHHNDIFNHDWLTYTVEKTMQSLLTTHHYVLFTDADELVIPIEGTLRAFIETATEECYRCTGYSLIGNHMYRDVSYDKTLLTRVPLKYIWGYHTSDHEPTAVDDFLLLYHLHRIDYDEALEKNWRWMRQNCWNKEWIRQHPPINYLNNLDKWTAWFYEHSSTLEPWHNRLRRELWQSESSPLLIYKNSS